MATPLDRPVTCPVVIGRARELAAVRMLIAAARAGQGQAALISGEAGIGKSRLVAEATRAAAAQGFVLLRGECFQADTAYPYAPMLDLLRALLARHLPALLATDQESLVRELVRLLPDLAIHFPQLASMSPPPAAGPEQQKRRLFAILGQLLIGYAAQQPLLLVIEDLHWCDESSLDLLLHLTRHCADQPFLFLFTYRSEEITPGLRHWLAQLDRGHLTLDLALASLSQAEVAAMLQAIFAAPRPVSPELAGSIYALAEGNPFFVEEVLKSLIVTGELRPAGGTWERRADGRPVVVLRSVQDAVRQRAERLSAAAKQALTLAAVAGRRFDFAVLQQLLGCDEDHLLIQVKELIAAQLVVEESADRFAFRHALIQQAVYGELLARERRALHRTIGEALEARYATPSQRDAHLAELAQHFYAAEAWDRALDYKQRAGESALALYAPGAAIEHLTQALESAERSQLTPPGKVYHARGQAYATRGDFDRARDDYERALSLADQQADGALAWQSMMALGLLWAGRDYAQVGAWFRRASDQASHFADPLLRARSLNRLGNWLVNTGRLEEGLRAHQEALEIFEEWQDTAGMAESLDLLGPAHGMRGDRTRAVEDLGRAITLFRALGDTQSLITSLGMRAIQSMPGASETTFSPLRTRDECVQDASEALHLARQVDSQAGQAFAGNALAHTLHTFGEFGPALACVREARRIATEIGHKQWLVATAYDLAHLQLLLLAPGPAIAAAADGLSLAQQLGSRFWSATLAATLGQSHTLNHDLPAAQATLQAVMPREQRPQNMAERAVTLAWGELALAQSESTLALQLADQLLASVPGLVPGQPAQPIPHLLKLRGEALLALSRPDEAAVALEEARRGALERDARPILWIICRSLGRAYQLLRRDDHARQELATARQLIEELAATIDDTPLRDQFRRAALDTLPEDKPLPLREVARREFGGLTAREREVAALIAQGKTSREIADLLVVSERTAEVHVSNILGKLGFTSRTQIAVWAVERGLAQP
jgi:DNA-binding CsgD family transcriptional regulator